MKADYFGRRRGAGKLLVCLFALLLCCLSFWGLWQKKGDRYALNAQAASFERLEIQAYDVDMTILPSRKVEVKERITVRFLDDYSTMFYRSLPTEGCKYEGIVASCENNNAFYYDVIDNPDVDGFIDVECIGGVERGAVWTYDIAYTMVPPLGDDERTYIDVIGYGWAVPLKGVTATVHFPAPLTEQWVYIGGYGSTVEGEYTLSEDKKTLCVRRDVLYVVYNGVYGESMAEGVTVGFAFAETPFVDEGLSRIFTEDMWKLALAAAGCIALGVLLLALKREREIIPVVNIKPPEGMSPMQMGKILDGNVDNEDLTSMIFYFAHKGYLKINLDNEDDPELVRLVPQLPEDCPAHEKTYFNGLFSGVGRVRISKLATRFYETSQAAAKQVLAPKPMYDRLSVFFFLLGGLIGFFYALLGGYFMGKKIGGGYGYYMGGLFLIPLALNGILAAMQSNYRYKWKTGKRAGFLVAEIVVALLWSWLFVGAFAEHLMTEWEKIVLCLGAFLPFFLTRWSLVRSERYVQTLDDVLGYKDFIVTTEEEKISFMLRENPELYYEVLPYAQVLGVTKEWEEKFKKITVQPPTWYEGDFTMFDYMLINRCITNSMLRSMAEAAVEAGSHVGRSGGGGGFGGFGGGGFGGGGGGAR